MIGFCIWAQYKHYPFLLNALSLVHFIDFLLYYHYYLFGVLPWDKHFILTHACFQNTLEKKKKKKRERWEWHSDPKICLGIFFLENVILKVIKICFP